ncbi:MAG: hypothetical protein QM754_03680 [Tepidisphaeraceae bacterium]
MLPRLLSLLQFTRIALVFTAIGDGWAALLLHKRATGAAITVPQAVAMTVASAALYTFGMAMNDLIDRRRDSRIAPGRPLPSGRLSVRSAKLVCAGLFAIAVAAGLVITRLSTHGWEGLAVLGVTLGLIAFYDFAGKYLVAPGLLTLGLIRGCHASIASPQLFIPWHPIVLLVHVTLLSTVCYHLEGKRPRLTLRHWLAVLAGLAAAVAAIVAVPLSRLPDGADWRQSLFVDRTLLDVGVSGVAFVLLAVTIRVRHNDARAAGRQIMLYGLLWLIVYDAVFVFGYASGVWAAAVLALLPMALLSVQAMRAWSKIVELSQKPQYQRAR